MLNLNRDINMKGSDKLVNTIGFAILGAKYIAVTFFAVMAFTNGATAAEFLVIGLEND